jgi:hypothetical protein
MGGKTVFWILFLVYGKRLLVFCTYFLHYAVLVSDYYRLLFRISKKIVRLQQTPIYGFLLASLLPLIGIMLLLVIYDKWIDFAALIMPISVFIIGYGI